MTSEPIRTCIVCRKKGVKNNFIKIVKNKDNTFMIEHEKRLDGRGAYICKSAECVQKCEKSKAINRAFKSVVPASVYEELKHEL